MRLNHQSALMGFILICLSLCACGPQQTRIERFVEDGVEVVVNHERPSKIEGEPMSFSLDEEFKIDTENETLAELGIRNVDEFEINAEGSVFLSTGEQVLQFDKEGRYVRAIGRPGQGPGEYQVALALRIMDSGELSFFDGENGKFLLFHSDGSWKEDIRKNSTIFTYQALPLENGHFVLQERWDEQEKGIRRFQYALLDEKFKKVKNFGPTFWIEIPFSPAKLNLLPHEMSCRVCRHQIFISSTTREPFEIEVYNFDGGLLRKIRRIAERRRVTAAYRERTLKRWQGSRAWKEWDLEKKHYFPEYFPPFRQFWVDDEGRIFVETYAQGEGPGEVLLDIFSPQGVFVGAKSLKEARDRRFFGNRMYAVYRKDSGYDVLMSYKMRWQ